MLPIPVASRWDNDLMNGIGLTAGTSVNIPQVDLAMLRDAGAPVTSSVICFAHGTRIATPGGEVPVDQLAVGDRVLTAAGDAVPIIWIGAGRVLVTPGRRSAATPVIVRRGALADNVPHRDLRVTKGHSLFLDAGHGERASSHDDRRRRTATPRCNENAAGANPLVAKSRLPLSHAITDGKLINSPVAAGR